MKPLCLFVFLAMAVFGTRAAERSFSIVFGNESTSTNTLTNATFLGSVVEGKSYIGKVTSVVAVFPDRTDCIRLSSNKTNGKFNIELAPEAQVVAKRIVLKAARYDNERDVDASIMLNSETLYITETVAGDYTLSIPSRPEKTLTNIIIDAEYRVYLYSITVWYDDSQGTVDPDVRTVATPVIVPAGGTISSGTEVSISCSTPDAKIYYTIDGVVPTSASPTYTSPFAVYNNLTVRAFACNDGMNPSEMAEAVFTVRNPQASLTAYFDFSDPKTLNPPLAEPEEKEYVLLDGQVFTDGDAAVCFYAGGEGNTHVRLYHSYDAGCDVRIYQGDRMTVSSLNPDIFIEGIIFEVSESNGSGISFESSIGEFDYMDYSWRPDEDTADSVEFISLFQSRLKSMTVYMKKNDGVSDLPYDHDVREAWYTIEGFRVPASIARPGFYIRVSDAGTDKIIVR